MGIIPGGINTFIRGILKWAPEDLDMSLVGVTTDPANRPVGKWSICDIGRRTFNFYPVFRINNPGIRSIIPLSLNFTLSLIWKRPKGNPHVLEFHRIEPVLAYYFCSIPKNAFFHQNMEVIYSKDCDIGWRHAPSIYNWLERRMLPKFASIYTVREDAAEMYRQRFPYLAPKVRFLPTWMDPEVFGPATAEQKKTVRLSLQKAFGIPLDALALISVGRLDSQKDPFLLLDAFFKLLQTKQNCYLMLVGDGVLRPEMERRISQWHLKKRVILLGMRSAHEVASYLQAANIFVLTSAYEGMPMCVIEALACGLPVITAKVGEVGKLVTTGENGEIVSTRSPEAFCAAILQCIAQLDCYSGSPCIESVRAYVPHTVLMPVYENYRKLARGETFAL